MKLPRSHLFRTNTIKKKNNNNIYNFQKLWSEVLAQMASHFVRTSIANENCAHRSINLIFNYPISACSLSSEIQMLNLCILSINNGPWFEAPLKISPKSRVLMKGNNHSLPMLNWVKYSRHNWVILINSTNKERFSEAWPKPQTCEKS